jgi:hypothetical protein
MISYTCQNLRKERDYETVFSVLLALMVLKRFLEIKLFLAVLHFVFKNYAEFQNYMKNILKTTTHGTFLQKISPLGVVENV